MKARMVLALVLVVALTGTVQPTQSKHSITFTFDYDFGATPACSSKVTKGCVQQFNLYDISAGIKKRTKLVSIPVPPGASGFVKGISGTTPPLSFESGKHLLGIASQMPNGLESDPSRCTFWVDLP